ncbi:hypothetical protein ABIA33_002189 [Streptacidiphilus sp. MAP12-16]|uniref:PspA-associated protein PspAA n=1 Tax=Streptacidiphilus sp. MAP12-16 TaxID=3156300 RepID=UPI0035131BD8
MIARILGEAQYEIPDQHVKELDELDADLQEAVESGSQAAFATALPALLAAVRRLGARLPDTTLQPSELVLPDQDMSLAQVTALLSENVPIPAWR